MIEEENECVGVAELEGVKLGVRLEVPVIELVGVGELDRETEAVGE